MVSTVTISTVTTVTTIAALGISATVSMGAVFLLILFLTTKELAGVAGRGFSFRIARFLSMGILPLVMAFTVIVIIKIAEVLA